jgi:hypothetical protein
MPTSEASGGAVAPTSESGATGGVGTPTSESDTSGGAPAVTPGSDSQTQSGAAGSVTPAADSQTQTQGAAPTPQAGGTPGAVAPQESPQAADSAPTVDLPPGEAVLPGSQITGKGVPGTTLAVLFDDFALDKIQVGPDGTWQFTVPFNLRPGRDTLRLLVIAPDGTVQTAVVEVPVNIVAMRLPVTGKKWHYWRHWRPCW